MKKAYVQFFGPKFDPSSFHYTSTNWLAHYYHLVRQTGWCVSIIWFAPPRPPWIDEDFDEFPEVPDPLATRTLLIERADELAEIHTLEDVFRQFGVIEHIIFK